MNKIQKRFWKLIEPEYKRAILFCRKLTGNREEADDLFQDSSIAAMNALENLKNEDAFKAWFYRIIVNNFNTSCKKSRWKNFVSFSEKGEFELIGENPTEKYNARRWLNRAFKEISADEQALITLHELEGWTISELAHVWKIQESAIKVRLFRARKKMKIALGEAYKNDRRIKIVRK